MQRLSIGRNMLFNTAGSLFYLVCQWLITVLAVRLGSYETGGMLSLSVQITNFLYVIATFSMRVFQASDTQGRFSASRYVSTRVMTSALSMLLCVLLSLCSVQYSGVQRWCIVLYMLFKMSESLVDTLAAEEQKAFRMDWCCVSFFLRGALSLGGFVAGMLFFRSLPAALALMAGLTLPVVLFYDGRIVNRLSKLKLDFIPARSMPLLKAAWPMMVNGAMMTLLTAIPRYFLEMYHGAEALGIYTAIATPAVVIQAGCSFIYSPLVAPLSEQYGKGDMRGFTGAVKKALLAVCLVALLAVAGAAVLGNWGLQLLFGQSILPHAHLLIPALVAALCSALIYFFEVPLTIKGKLTTMSVIHLCATAGTVVLSMVLIPQMGMDGVNLTMYLASGADVLAMGIAALGRRKTA